MGGGFTFRAQYGMFSDSLTLYAYFFHLEGFFFHLCHSFDVFLFVYYPLYFSMKKVCFKTLVDEVQELEALSKDPGAVVHGKR